MKIYQFSESTNSIVEISQSKKINPKNGGSLIMMTNNLDGESSDTINIQKNGTEFGIKISKDEFRNILEICGYKNISTEKIKLYTPELFVMAKKGNSKKALLKLGEYCLILENEKLRIGTVFDMSESFAQFIEFENIFVGGEYE